MTQRRWPLVAAIIAAAALLAVLPSRGQSEDEASAVRVINFPRTQRISGDVVITEPIRQASLISLPDIEVPPVKPADPRRLIAAGTITTDGFTGAILSLSVEARGQIVTPAEVGAILVPDEEPIIKVMEERGQLQFPLEVKAMPSAGALYFASEPARVVVGFPRYRVLIYNATGRTVTVSLFAYLTG